MRFEVCRRKCRKTRQTNRWEEREGGKNTHTTYYMLWEAGRDVHREIGGNGCRAGERDGERSSLGNLFWSSQSADTQGAGKPITV